MQNALSSAGSAADREDSEAPRRERASTSGGGFDSGQEDGKAKVGGKGCRGGWLGYPNFGRSALGCIDAENFNESSMCQHFSISTKLTRRCAAKNSNVAVCAVPVRNVWRIFWIGTEGC